MREVSLLVIVLEGLMDGERALLLIYNHIGMYRFFQFYLYAGKIYLF